MLRNIGVRPKNKTDKCDILGKRKIVLQLPCKHQYHFSCYRQWEKHSDTCPTCRYYNFFQCYHYAFSTLVRNARYWPSYYNRVLSQLRYYIRKCKYHKIPFRNVNKTILTLSTNYIHRQNNREYYDQSLYDCSHKKNLSIECLIRR